jgi:hypothetical protein
MADNNMESIPDKIATALQRQLRFGEVTQGVLKTAWKPSATIPILWLIVTNMRCILLSTLRGSHIFSEVDFSGINSARQDGTVIHVFFSNGEADWTLPIDAQFQKTIEQTVSTINSKK